VLIILVRFQIKPEKAAAFRERVTRQAADSLTLEPACRRFDVAVDPTDETRILLYEIYDDDAAFAAHLKSEHFLAFDADVRTWSIDKVVERWRGPLP
jgi:quinol monooxygenase YgiN